MTDTSMQKEVQKLDEWEVKMLLNGQKTVELCKRSITTSPFNVGRELTRREEAVINLIKDMQKNPASS